jgi:hypothetical protein
MNKHKHPDELPDEILIYFGFVKKKNEFNDLFWTHQEADGFYYHVLTPLAVKVILIEIGRNRAFSQINQFIAESKD